MAIVSQLAVIHENVADFYGPGTISPTTGDPNVLVVGERHIDTAGGGPLDFLSPVGTLDRTTQIMTINGVAFPISVIDSSVVGVFDAPLQTTFGTFWTIDPNQAPPELNRVLQSTPSSSVSSPENPPIVMVDTTATPPPETVTVNPDNSLTIPATVEPPPTPPPTVPDSGPFPVDATPAVPLQIPSPNGEAIQPVDFPFIPGQSIGDVSVSLTTLTRDLNANAPFPTLVHDAANLFESTISVVGDLFGPVGSQIANIINDRITSTVDDLVGGANQLNPLPSLPSGASDLPPSGSAAAIATVDSTGFVNTLAFPATAV